MVSWKLNTVYAFIVSVRGHPLLILWQYDWIPTNPTYVIYFCSKSMKKWLGLPSLKPTANSIIPLKNSEFPFSSLEIGGLTLALYRPLPRRLPLDGSLQDLRRQITLQEAQRKHKTSWHAMLLGHGAVKGNKSNGIFTKRRRNIYPESPKTVFTKDFFSSRES